MSYAVQQVHGLRLVVFAEAGPMLKDENDVSLFIAPAFEHEAGMIALPVKRLDAAFFQLRSGIAGAVLQKFINYRLRVALLGDITPWLAKSNALQDFVREANRGEQVWFLSSLTELEQRLGT
ncbi:MULTISPECIES: DUF4180 domain-containing protein [Serratia]|uniref:DUF4180 domain-containing protein n=1 Tax=Serratia TaxID=613 RepID=UPI000E3DA883|nr:MULTISPECIES: DUF4180 domain-containing protein [Serratia]MBH3122380.1 DUF4180 domain-containing protein [Serratia ureilytica]MBH3156116.1 DUF4180 domain-containing protein [Serratia ureilytica]MBH3251206.1 DUF4180 domain-containing protein [Serratia ureilytica]MBN5281110.1 DUF4180 domain-containing protein [Serratia ureilytica]MBN5371270.1 DUF4180 domain-containing protein [Serratia ureilytica]